MKMRIFIIFFILAVVLVASIFSIKNYFYYSKKSEIVKSVEVSKDLVLNNLIKYSNELVNSDGISFNKQNNVKFEDFVVLSSDNELIVHFWASWCDPCINEIPDLLEYLKRRKSDIDGKKLSIIFVSLDYDTESLNKFLKSFPELKNSQYLLLMDKDGLIQKTFDIDRVPSTFFIKNSSIEKFLTVVDWKRR